MSPGSESSKVSMEKPGSRYLPQKKCHTRLGMILGNPWCVGKILSRIDDSHEDNQVFAQKYHKELLISAKKSPDLRARHTPISNKKTLERVA